MSDAPLTSTVSGLSDRRLLAQIKEMVDREKHFTLVIVDHLREIEARSLHLERGFGSLFDYAVTELGYTPSAAWRRIQAMHLSSQFDGVRERLEDGSLTVTAATQLQTAFDRNERQVSVAAAVARRLRLRRCWMSRHGRRWWSRPPARARERWSGCWPRWTRRWCRRGRRCGGSLTGSGSSRR